MGYETRTCAGCGQREPMDLPREARFAGVFGPLCDDCLPLALQVAEANAANAAPDPALMTLARFGAEMCANAAWPLEPAEGDDTEPAPPWMTMPDYIDLSGGKVAVLMKSLGMFADDVGNPAPGIADAIAELLAPDVARSEVAP